MPKVAIPDDVNVNKSPEVSGLVQRKVGLASTAVAATQTSGSAVALASGSLTDPPSDEADRGVVATLAGGGTPGDYVVTGTYNGEEVSETITTVAGSDVYGDQPFDTFSSIAGPDPAADLDFALGDVFAYPPARALWTGPTGGSVQVQLEKEEALQVVASLPASFDWDRRIRRIRPASTTIPTGEAYLVW
jgi:hypothetical protein